MKKIFRIAKVELGNLFYSPIAWVLIVIFLFQSGVAFFPKLHDSLMFQGEGNVSRFMVTMFFSDSFTSNGLFKKVVDSLYFYIPLLTMGLMSREYASGSIKLLLSSPVKASHIIIGKFFAVMSYWFILFLVLVLYVIVATLTVGNADLVALLTGLVGLILLASAYSAIGLFMSTLTSNQVIAAISTLVALSLLNFIGDFTAGAKALGELVYFLDAKSHTENLLLGFIVSKDIVYFSVLTFLFLGYSIFTVKIKIESGHFMIKAGRYAIWSITLLFCGYILSKRPFQLYYDSTQEQISTVAPSTQKLLKRFDGPLTITAFDNLVSSNLTGIADPGRRSQFEDAWSRYTRYLKNVKFSYVRFYDTAKGSLHMQDPNSNLVEIAKQQVRLFETSLDDYLPPSEIRKRIDLSAYGNNSIYLLEYNGRREFLRFYPSNFWRLAMLEEDKIATAFQRLIDDTIPRISVVSGHMERGYRNDDGLNILLNDYYNGVSLVNRGFDVNPASLDTAISPKTDIIVIADPTKPYSQDEIERIEKYVAEGKNMFICGEDKSILDPIIHNFGVQIREGKLVEESLDYAPEMISAKLSSAASHISPFLGSLYSDSAKINMREAVAIEKIPGSSFKAEPLLVTNAKTTWNRMEEFNAGTSKLSYNPEGGDDHSSLPVAMALSREFKSKQQRIVVVGDADFASDINMQRELDGAKNREVITEMFRWLSYERYPLDIHRKETENRIKINFRQFDTIKTVIMGILPLLIVVAGAVYLAMRKRK